MSAETPSWIAQLDPKDCGIEGIGLMFRYQKGAPLQFLTDVLAHDAGQRDWSRAARDFLRQREFTLAAQCARHATDPSLADEIQEHYQTWHKQVLQAVEDLERSVRELDRSVGDLPSLKNAKDWLEIAKDALSGLPPNRPGLLGELETLSPKLLTDFEEARGTAQRELALAQKEGAQKQEERKRQLRDLSRKISEMVDDLLLGAIDSVLASKVEHLAERARAAVKDRDLDKLTHLHALLKKVAGGQQLSEEEMGPLGAPGSRSEPVIYASADRQVIGSWGPAGAPELGSVRVKLTELSDLVQQDLERSQGKSAAPAVSQPSDPLDFDKKRLEQQYASAKAAAADGNFAGMGQYLLSWAKINLLEKRYDRALTIFHDALRWLCQSEQEQRSCDVAMWGLLLSLALPYLQKEEQQSTLTATNLSELCERKIGYFPLLRIEKMGLIPQLAQHIIKLKWPTAGRVVSAYLLSYFGVRSIAASEFAAEVAAAAPTHPSTLSLLALLYDDQLFDPQPGDIMRQFAGTDHALQDARQKREFCLQLRAQLLPYGDDWELVASVTEALQQRAEQLQRPQTERSWRIVHDLLSPEVTLVEGSRLLIRLKSEASTTLRGVSTTARLLADPRSDAKVFHGVLAPLEPLANVEPGVTYERAIDLVSFGDELHTSLYLELQHSAHSEDGTDRLLETRTRFFSLRFSPPRQVIEQPPPNPYTFGRPIQNPDSIFGREKFVNQICDALIGRDQDNAVLVLGDRKIGKTTLLSALQEHPRIVSRYVPLYIDLEKIPDYCENVAFYFQYLIQPIQQKLRNIGLNPVNCTEASLQRSPESVFEDFFRQTDQLLRANSRRLLLVLDEFERVIDLVDQSGSGKGAAERRGMGPEVLAALRAAIQPSRFISLILSGVTYLLRRHTVHQNDRLARFGAEIELPSLDENGAQLLVKLPARGQYEVTPSAVELILRETARQPYLIQKLCHHLFTDMIRYQSRLATASDVQKILDRMARDASGFVHLLEPIQSANDFRLIQAMAMLQSGRNYVRLKDLVRQLKRESGKADEAGVRQRLTELAERVPSVVERHPISPYQFRLTVGVFARFLRQQPESKASFCIRSKGMN